MANLVTEEDTETPLLPVKNYLSGTTVSSLYRLRDVDNSDGGFFVFGDLAVKQEGKFKLRFSLFEIVEYVVLYYYIYRSIKLIFIIIFLGVKYKTVKLFYLIHLLYLFQNIFLVL